MTLATRVRIASPRVVPAEVFDFVRGLLGAGGDVGIIRGTEPGALTLRHDWSKGLAAMLSVTYGADGPLPSGESETVGDGDPEEEGWGWDPEAFIEIDLDTAYSYQAANGAGCADLHRWMVEEIGDYLDARGATWWWYDESGYADGGKQGWHEGRHGLDQFGSRGHLDDRNYGRLDPKAFTSRQGADLGFEFMVIR